jgi:ABC-type xylose transport system permease subunit
MSKLPNLASNSLLFSGNSVDAISNSWKKSGSVGLVIIVLILGQGGLLGAVFGFIVSIFKIPAVIGILIIILALVIHYNNKEKK